MSTGTLSEFSSASGGVVHGEDTSFVGVSIDSRTLKAGELYVALRGLNFDGHEFVADVAASGAAGAVVEARSDASLAQVVVADSRRALGDYAAAWRARFKIATVAVTGSNGKTSVKEMLAAILAQRGETLATRGNFNNDVGVPLTLLRLTQRHRAAVIEIGASAVGEVAALARLARPAVAIITNASSAHLEGFGSVGDVAKAKGELIGALEADGVAVLNADDAYAGYWRELAGLRRVLTFGASDKADFYFSDFAQTVSGATASSSFIAHTPMGDERVTLPFGGRHNVRNALAAAAAAHALGVGLSQIVAGLAQAVIADGRLQIRQGMRGARLIDDSYNANPASARAAIEFLAEQREPGWLVLGDMKELGDDARQMHVQIGKYARENGIARLYAIGELSRSAAVAFGREGRWFESHDALIAQLQSDLTDGVNVLLKGSRSMRLEQVVDALWVPAADKVEV